METGGWNHTAYFPWECGLERRVSLLVEFWIQADQCGVRGFHGTLNQLFILSKTIEGGWEFAQLAYICGPREVICPHPSAYPGVCGAWSIAMTCFIPLLSLHKLYLQVGNKSDSFLERIGLHQGYPLSLTRFVVFMDRFSRHSHLAESFHFCGLRISSHLFADDVVLVGFISQV